jgi:hypothetical protein
MKKLGLICGSFLISCLMPAFAAAQFNRGGDRVCFYQDNNYRGNDRCYAPGDEISDIRNARISSIRIDGRARVIVYGERNFRGNEVEFRNDVPDLAQVRIPGSRSSWNDRIGSIRVVSDNGRYDSRNDRQSGRYGYPNPQDNYPYPQGRSQSRYPQSGNNDEGVCVYEKPNYQGRSQCWSSSVDLGDLGPSGWSDKIQSVRVYGGARVMAFRDIHYQGERVLIDRDVANLDDLGMRAAGNWNRQISSLQVEGARGNGRYRRWN